MILLDVYMWELKVQKTSGHVVDTNSMMQRDASMQLWQGSSETCHCLVWNKSWLFYMHCIYFPLCAFMCIGNLEQHKTSRDAHSLATKTIFLVWNMKLFCVLLLHHWIWEWDVFIKTLMLRLPWRNVCTEKAFVLCLHFCIACVY